MKKRSYRKISINQFRADLVTAVVPPGRIIFAIDVAKVDMVAAVADERGQPVAFVSWKNPTENSMVLGLLAELRAGGYTLEAVMEPSGTYGDVLRYQLLEAGIPVFRVSGKRTHDAREVYDGVPSLHDAKSAAILAKLHVDGISAAWGATRASARELACAPLARAARNPGAHQRDAARVDRADRRTEGGGCRSRPGTRSDARNESRLDGRQEVRQGD
jgi:transposase